MNFDINTVAWAVTAILTLLSIIFGTKWSTLKSKLVGTIKESADVAITANELLKSASVALEDNNLTPEEINTIKSDLKQFVEEFEDIKEIWKADPKVPVE